MKMSSLINNNIINTKSWLLFIFFNILFMYGIIKYKPINNINTNMAQLLVLLKNL